MRPAVGKGRARKDVQLTAFVLFAAAAQLACGDTCDERPPVAPVALSIELQDAQSGAAICDAKVIIQRGDETGTLAGICRYSGGSEAGLYEITITHPGYQDTVVSDVLVEADECATAVTKKMTIEMEPSSA